MVSRWDNFLDHYLDPDQARSTMARLDTIVPTPLMPHLLAHWIERQAHARWPDREVSLVPADAPLGTPYDRLHTDGVRYVSFADWLCPTHCVEPLLLPGDQAHLQDLGDELAAVTSWTAARGRERPTAAPAAVQLPSAWLLVWGCTRPALRSRVSISFFRSATHRQVAIL